MRITRMMVFSPQDTYLFDVAPNSFFGGSFTEEVNGQHSMSMVTTQKLEKEQRILFEDATEKWREYVVTGIDKAHQNNERMFGQYQMVWSLQHDLQLYTIDELAGIEDPITAISALDIVLSGTSRWVRGTVTQDSYGEAEMIMKSGWESLSILLDVWGGEVDAEIEVDSTGIISRKVNVLSMLGSRNVTRRFDYSRDMEGIRQKVDETPIACQIIPLGKSEKDIDGFDIPLTIEEVNDGKNYLRNEETAPLFRLPDGNGGWEYTEVKVENNEIEDEEELLEWGLSVLDEYTKPKVTYEADVLQFVAAGMDAKGVELGDTVHCVDRSFGDGEIRIEGRIVSVTVDLADQSKVSLKVGELKQSAFSSMMSSVATMKSVISNLSAGVTYTTEYLNNLIDNLNDEINANGGYTYIIKNQGIRTYDKAVSDPTRGLEADKVVEIKGGSIRIADSKTAQGEWEWRTVFVSGHIAADMVTAANLTAGYIGNASNGSFWNLDNNRLQIATGAIVGDRTVQDMLDDVDSTVTGVTVEYAQNQNNQYPPATGWGPVAPTYQEGWYIWQRTKTVVANSQTPIYSDPTCISGREGRDGTSVSILGSYDTLAELQAAHPTGNQGDGYIVAGDLYVWDGSAWLNVGRIQGPAGTNGQGVTISSRSIRYAKSTSGTTAPTSGWQENPPSTVAGEYLWSRTYVMYTDGTDTTTYGVAGHGQNGLNGTDGTSVTVTKTEYGTSANASTQPSSWSTTVPSSISEGTWLWCKTTFSNDSTATTKSYVGTDGKDGKSVTIQSASKSGKTTTVVIAETDPETGQTTPRTLTIVDGDDGEEGTNGLNGYVHTAWANSADGSADFSTTVSANKLYLGVYTDNTQTDSQSPSAYSWSLIKGADGQDGEDGIGIVSVTPQYYLSTSSSSATGGSWSSTPPTWSADHYIWTRSFITWDTNPITTTTTTPVYDAALTQANQQAAQAIADAADAAKVAINYLTFDQTDGLDVGYSGTNAKTRINGNGVEIFDEDGTSMTKVQSGKMRIGENGKTRAEIDWHSLQLVDREGSTYMYVSDLRDADGYATVTDTYVRWGISTFYMAESIPNSDYTIKINGVDRTSEFRRYPNYFYYNGSGTLADGTVVNVTYRTSLSRAKAYTFGLRKTNSPLGIMSFAEGYLTEASGAGSHAEGYYSQAAGIASHAEGGYPMYSEPSASYVEQDINPDYPSKALGIASHAESGGIAKGPASRAFFKGTAIGFSSVAHGLHAEAKGSYGYAIGPGTVALDYQFVYGAWNVQSDSQIFTLGIGLSSSSRATAFYVSETGNGWFKGSCTATSHPTSSDKRLKKHVEYIGDDMCDFIRRLKPVRYRWTNNDDGEHYGFYAQDVQDADPYDTATVTSVEDGNLDFDPLTLDYNALIAPLVAYTQQLERRIDEQQQQMDDMQRKIDRLMELAGLSLDT